MVLKKAQIRGTLFVSLFYILTIPLFADCVETLGGISRGFNSAIPGSAIFDRPILVGYTRPNDLGVAVSHDESDLVIRLYSETRVNTGASVRQLQGEMRIPKNDETNKFTVSFYDFHTAIWNLGSIPMREFSKRRAEIEYTKVAWKKLSELNPLIFTSTGTSLNLIEDKTSFRKSDFTIADGRKTYTLRFQLNELNGVIDVSLLDPDTSAELASIEYMPSSLNPEIAFGRFSQILEEQGVSDSVRRQISDEVGRQLGSALISSSSKAPMFKRRPWYQFWK